MLALLAAIVAPRIVEIGAPPNAEKIEAVAINERGEVLLKAQESVDVPWEASNGEKGVSHIPVNRGYLWRGGRLLALDVPKGSVTFDPPNVVPAAINDLSISVGSRGPGTPLFMSGLSDNDATIWRGTKLADLGFGHTSAAEDINNYGDVVGGGDHRAFARLRGRSVWFAPMSNISPADPSGEMNDANSCDAVAINDRRQILMNSTYGKRPGSGFRPFLIDGNARRSRPVAVLLPKGVGSAVGIALNERGTVLSASLGPRYPFLTKGGRTIRLSARTNDGIEAADLNDQDEVVGKTVSEGNPQGLSPLYWRNGKEMPLPKFSGWTLMAATGINNRGQICGTGLHNGKIRAFVISLR